MGYIIMGIIFILMGIAAIMVKIPQVPFRDRMGNRVRDEQGNVEYHDFTALNKTKNITGGFAIFGALAFIASGAVSYNDSGYCQHVQTIWGQETYTCNIGWYIEGYGTSTPYPHFITVAHTNDQNVTGSSISQPYSVRLADNWNGEVIQTTRFGIPQDEASFLKMHNTFRSKDRLIATTLKPAITSSLDSISNLYSMEEYYAGGKRDQYKTEFRDAVIKGRPRVKQVSSMDSTVEVVAGGQTATDDPFTADNADVGETQVRRIVMEKILDSSGAEIREVHDYAQYGITVSSAILENLDPDNLFEKQIQARKDAASRRIVAQEERREQEEQRLLAIQRGQTDIARKQAEAETVQIERTTNAETEKQLALIEASRQKEEAEIARQTSEINLERAKIDAQAVEVTADAEAYQKQVILEADGALQQKLDAWVKSQEYWAAAAAKINVPQTVFGAGGSGVTGQALTTVDQFMQIMTANAAKDLKVNPAISK